MKTDTEILNALFWEFHEINERILTLDICSSKTGMPRAIKFAEKARKDLIKAGCTEVYIDPFEAQGGWIGITYEFNTPSIGRIGGSCTPRRQTR